jgi:hypothetical protein
LAVAGAATFRISEDDHQVALRTVQLRYLRSRRFLIKMAAACAIVIVLLPALAAAGGYDIRTSIVTSLVGVLGGFAGLIVVIAGNLLLLPRRARRVYRQNRRYEQDVTLAWSDDGLSWRSRSGSSQTDWPDIHAWRSTPRVTLIHFSDALFQVVPARALDDAAYRDLVATLERHAGPAR